MGRLNFEVLKNLQNSTNDLLQSPIIRQTLVGSRQEKHVHEVSEASLRTLDVCGISKDVLLLVKEHIKDFQHMLRRFNIGSELSQLGRKVSACNGYRKKLRKETLKCLNSLKAVKGQPVVSDEILLVVVEVLQEVRVTTISIVESLLGLIAKPWLNFKSPRGSSGSNFAFKFNCVRDQDHSLNDICEAMELQSSRERLEAVVIAIEFIEVELDCIFRRLIEMRVSLLNILTSK